MKTNVLVFGLLYLLLGWMLPVCTRKTSGTFITQDDQSLPLNMEKGSVDDMYSTCSVKMEAKVKDTLFEKEMKDELFRKAWTAAKKCANEKMKERERGDEALTKHHMHAICVYTAGGPANFYRTFNEAVRTNRSQYSSSFPFHSLHFWLTSAIKILNNKKNCYTTFRRTKSKFTGNVDKVIRFGTFTSTSKLATLITFGHTTCFKIRTCHGAHLKKYPKLKDKEQEVLIPPYEKFTIIKKGTFRKKLSDCEIVYVLKSNGVRSNLDCQNV